MTLLEKDVEHLCDQLIETHQGKVVRYSQARASRQTKGIADREYFVLGARIRYEVKRELDGKLSSEQFDILRHEHDTGGIAACGGLEELRHLLVSLRHSKDEARRLGWLFVQLWAARGLRGKKRRMS